jgi:dynein heavy chain
MECEQKVIRASSLIGELGTEQTRWEQMVERLESRLQFVLGDIVMGSGIIAYLGPFSQSYRSSQVFSWIDYIKS